MSVATLFWGVSEFNTNGMVHCGLASFDAEEWSQASVIY